MNDHATINQRIAGALGEVPGTYENLLGTHVCTALGIDPAFRGQLVPSPSISPTTVSWLRDVAKSTGPDAGNASEILTALQL